MNVDAPDPLDAGHAAISAACEAAERLLGSARALRHSQEALRRRFDRLGVRWQGSPECYSYEKALQQVAEQLYEAGGSLFRLCHAHRCTLFDVQSQTTRPVNAIGERAMCLRKTIADAGFGVEPPLWQDRGPAIAAADAVAGLPPELADLPSLQWALEQDAVGRGRDRQTRDLVAAAFLLLGAAGASVSGILSKGEGGVGLLFALALVAAGGWCVASLIMSIWRRLRRYRLLRKPSMRILAQFHRLCS